MASIISAVAANEFTGEVSWNGSAIVIQLCGSADLTTTELLRVLLFDAHAAAKVLSAKCALVDIRTLRFMNSSCICALLGWANTVANGRPDEQYPIEVRWDPAIGWERRTLKALLSVVSGAVTLDPTV
jgi:hypothetical protein